jgi:hypothetical protein
MTRVIESAQANAVTLIGSRQETEVEVITLLLELRIRFVPLLPRMCMVVVTAVHE